MKMKIVLPWLCVLALLAGVLFLYSSTRQKEAELTALRPEKQEAERLRAELEQIKTSTAEAQNEEIARLRKDNQELLRLRNEIRQVREEKQQLTRQLQTAQTVRIGAQQQEQRLQQLQAENQQFRTVVQQGQQEAQRNACINNLRQIDGAKQQWALENKKTAHAVPTPQDLAPYFKDRVVPVCPAGGVYTFNAVGTMPICSIPGHTLSP